MMKNKQALLLFAIFLVSSSNLIAQLSLSPEKIIAGEKVTLTYDPLGTPLEKEEEVVINIFQFDNYQYESVEIPVNFQNGKFVGSFTTEKATKAVLFEITNGDMKKRDNKDKKGYKTICYQSDKETPVKGAYASKAYIVGQYGYIVGMDRDAEKAMVLLAKEFASHPTSSENLDYQRLHLNLASSSKDEDAIESHHKKVDQILADKSASEEELSYAYSFNRIKKDEAGIEKVKNHIIAVYPAGSLAANELSRGIRGAKDVEEKVAIYEKFNEKFSELESADRTKDYMIGIIASDYIDSGDLENFRKYFSMLDNRLQKASSLNNIAWSMTGESLDGEASDPVLALELSKESLDLIEAEKKDHASISKTTTKRKHERNLKNSYAMYADTYALAAYKNGKMEEALNYQLISCENGSFKNGEMAQRYSAYFEKVNSPEETEILLSNLIEEGKATSVMKEQHRRLYLANNTMETAYEKYVSQLGKSALAKKKAELKESMIEKPAPNFSLVNLEGSKVNLEDLKGKVVVVDFWATWCGPCITSFPGMQKAVNKFEQSDDVAFVFIDTWESGENITEKVAKFIESNDYSFHVLMDLDAKVVSSFGVSGIPTKFVIDKEGVIRFKSVGFAGNDESLVDEMTMMIELAGGTVPRSKTLTP